MAACLAPSFGVQIVPTKLFAGAHALRGVVPEAPRRQKKVAASSAQRIFSERDPTICITLRVPALHRVTPARAFHFS